MQIGFISGCFSACCAVPLICVASVSALCRATYINARMALNERIVSVFFDINQVEFGMETKGGSGAIQNESRQDPWAPGIEYGVCPGPQVPTDDEMSLLSLSLGTR